MILVLLCMPNSEINVEACTLGRYLGRHYDYMRVKDVIFFEVLRLERITKDVRIGIYNSYHSSIAPPTQSSTGGNYVILYS